MSNKMNWKTTAGIASLIWGAGLLIANLFTKKDETVEYVVVDADKTEDANEVIIEE